MEKENLKYAGFFTRAMAYIIDFVLIIIVFTILTSILMYITGLGNKMNDYNYFYLIIKLWSIVFLTVYISYFTLLESKLTKKNTLGKQICRIIVLDKVSNSLSIRSAFLRSIIKLPSIFVFGYVLIIITKKRQSLHDLIIQTVVVRR